MPDTESTPPATDLICRFCGGALYHPVIKTEYKGETISVTRPELWCTGCTIEIFGSPDGVWTAEELVQSQTYFEDGLKKSTETERVRVIGLIDRALETNGRQVPAAIPAEEFTAQVLRNLRQAIGTETEYEPVPMELKDATTLPTLNWQKVACRICKNPDNQMCDCSLPSRVDKYTLSPKPAQYPSSFPAGCRMKTNDRFCAAVACTYPFCEQIGDLP